MKISLKNAALILTSITCLQGLILENASPALSNPTAKAQDNLQQLLKTKSCKGCDLAELDLTRMDLSGVDVEGADLSHAKLYLANLSGANLRNTKLDGAVFGGADLGKADLRGADLQNVSLDNAYLGETLMDSAANGATSPAGSGKNVTEKRVNVAATAQPKESPPQNEVKSAVQTGTMESTATGKPATDGSIAATSMGSGQASDVPKGASASSQPVPSAAQTTTGADGIRADNPKKDPVVAQVADSDGAAKAPIAGKQKKKPALTPDEIRKNNLARLLDKNKCYECDLSGLDLSGKDLEGADLEQANLSGCNLEKADLDEANLKGAVLSHANLRKANLKEADLYKADLSGADLTKAKVKGAMFDGAKTTETIGFSGSSIMIKK